MLCFRVKRFFKASISIFNRFRRASLCYRQFTYFTLYFSECTNTNDSYFTAWKSCFPQIIVNFFLFSFMQWLTNERRDCILTVKCLITWWMNDVSTCEGTKSAKSNKFGHNNRCVENPPNLLHNTRSQRRAKIVAPTHNIK